MITICGTVTSGDGPDLDQPSLSFCPSLPGVEAPRLYRAFFARGAHCESAVHIRSAHPVIEIQKTDWQRPTIQTVSATEQTDKLWSRLRKPNFAFWDLIGLSTVTIAKYL